MSKVVDAPADSSPAAIDINEGFAEFQAEQRAARNQSVETATPLEPAPASEPEEPAGDEPVTAKQEPLTDEQKSAAKRANNEKRWDKLLRERDEAKAELERLKTKPAEPAAPATAKSKVVHVDDPSDPRPKQEDFTDFDEYVDARSTWNARQVIKADRESQTAAAIESQKAVVVKAFRDEVAEYGKSKPDFIGTAEDPGILTMVGDELEDGLQVVSSSIMENEKRLEIIDFLGRNPEAFDKILSHRENPAKALIELGRIIAAEFESSPAPVPATPTRRTLPKPPAAVTGRGHTPSGEAALDAAAEANDFTAFQKTLRARDRRG